MNGKIKKICLAAIVVLLVLVVITICIFFYTNKKNENNIDFYSYDIEMTTELDGTSFVFVNEKMYKFDTEDEAGVFQSYVYNLDNYTYANVDKAYEEFNILEKTHN